MNLARILPPPEVKYRGQGNNEVAERVAIGKWAIRNRFYASPIINQWGIIYFGSKPDKRIISILQEFENELPSVSHQRPLFILMIYIEHLANSSIWYHIQIKAGDYSQT